MCTQLPNSVDDLDPKSCLLVHLLYQYNRLEYSRILFIDICCIAPNSIAELKLTKKGTPMHQDYNPILL